MVEGKETEHYNTIKVSEEALYPDILFQKELYANIQEVIKTRDGTTPNEMFGSCLTEIQGIIFITCITL